MFGYRKFIHITFIILTTIAIVAFLIHQARADQVIGDIHLASPVEKEPTISELTGCVSWGDDVELENNHVAWNNCAYHKAEATYVVPWEILSAVHLVESGRRNYFKFCNYAGACGSFQFLRGTFRAYKQDGNGDDFADIYAFHDGLYSAANLLATNHHPDWMKCGEEWGQTLFNYNHACWYVAKVMATARIMNPNL